MRNISYIFNFNKWPVAALWSVLAIICVEVAASQILPSKFSYHETDRLLYDIDHKKYNADIVLLGDSVGYQIVNSIFSRLAKQEKLYVNLTTNQAVEMAGQFYIIERYLKKNKKPKAVIFLGQNPLGKNLNQKYTENYVKRCFLNLNEIVEITSCKGIGFGFAMVIYKLFPSYKYRFFLQKKILGNTDTNIKTGLKREIKKKEKKKMEAAGEISLKHTPKGGQAKGISNTYFVRLVALLREKNIKFYFLPVPISKKSDSLEENKKYEDMFSFFSGLRKKNDNFQFVGNIIFYPDHFFFDDRHLAESGLDLAGSWLEGKLSTIRDEMQD